VMKLDLRDSKTTVCYPRIGSRKFRSESSTTNKKKLIPFKSLMLVEKRKSVISARTSRDPIWCKREVESRVRDPPVRVPVNNQRTPCLTLLSRMSQIHHKEKVGDEIGLAGQQNDGLLPEGWVEKFQV
jgi:hypothetical protein